MLEILELKSALEVKNMLEGKAKGLIVQGHLKIGFNTLIWTPPEASCPT